MSVRDEPTRPCNMQSKRYVRHAGISFGGSKARFETSVLESVLQHRVLESVRKHCVRKHCVLKHCVRQNCLVDKPAKNGLWIEWTITEYGEIFAERLWIEAGKSASLLDMPRLRFWRNGKEYVVENLCYGHCVAPETS